MITPTLQMGSLRHREHYSLSRGCTLRNQDLNRGSMVSEYSFITTVFYPLNPPMLSGFYSAFQSVCLSLGPQLTCTCSTTQVGTSLLWLPAQAQSQKSTWDKMPWLRGLRISPHPQATVPRLICLKSSFFLSLLCSQTCSHGSI